MSGPWRLVDGPAGTLRSYSTEAAGPSAPVLLLCHELPRVKGGAAAVGRTYPALADRLAQESGWRVVVGTLRGAGGSEGDFSAAGWVEDLRCLVDAEVGPAGRVWVAGFGLGGAVALRLSVGDDRVAGVASLGAPDDLSAWLAEPRVLLDRCRLSGVVSTKGFPADPAAWAAELAALEPLEAAGDSDRPLLVVHGSDDPDVPVAAARALADAAAGPVEIRIVPGAGHWLRADPRVVASLIGWIERQG